MKFYSKYIIAALVLVLAGSLAVPICQAQAQPRVITRVLNMDSDGGYLGIGMKEVTADDMSTYKLKEERGVIINSVVQGSPAEEAKLQEKDVILEFADIHVWSTQQFSRLVKETPVGRTVELGISRDGKRLELAVKIGKREARSDRAGNEAGRNMWVLPAPNDRLFEDYFRGLPDGIPVPRTEGKPRLGVTLLPLTDQLGEHLGVPGGKGALVSSVAKDSPSAGKLNSGDVITEADGKTVNNPDDLARVVRENEGGTIILKVIRDKKKMTITVSLPSEENQRGYRL
jgi:serine protease Do